MRLLVFCGTRKSIERFDMAPDWKVIVSAYPPFMRQKMVQDFCDTPGAKLAVDRSMLHGWRAPADTVVLFDTSWPYRRDDPESIQAAARVENPERWGV